MKSGLAVESTEAISTKYPVIIFLLSLYPVLSIYSLNMKEIDLLDTVSHAFGSLVLAVCLFFIFNYFFKEKNKSAVYLVFFLSIFFYVDLLRAYLYGLNPEVFRARYFLPFVLILLVLSSLWIKKSHYRFDFVIPPLNAFSLTVLLMVVSQIGFNYKDINWNFESKAQGTEPNAQSAKNKVLPNVFFIILDEYSAFRSIKQIYNYNNDEFMGFLQNQGFFVGGNSRTRYPDTTLSIPSTLNMKYLDEGLTMKERFNYYNNSLVFSEFSKLGYVTNSFGLFVYQNFLKVETDYFYDNYQSKSPIFESLIEKSILESVFHKHTLKNMKIGDEKNILDLFSISRKTNQFVFLHLLLPHAWFRYLADGTDQSIFNRVNYKDKQVYLEQYKYTTLRIQSIVQNLLNETPESIIILQSDHGMRYRDQPFAKKEDIDRESHYILNAIYMPNGDYVGLKDDMKNVDTFKFLLPKIRSYESSKRAIN